MTKWPFTNIEVDCPFCGRHSIVTASTLVPRIKHDCRGCKSVLEVRPIRSTPKFAVWATDWTIAGVEVQ